MSNFEARACLRPLAVAVPGIVGIVCLTGLLSCAAPAHRLPRVDVPRLPADQVLLKLQEKEAAIRTLKGLFRAKVAGTDVPIASRLDGVFFYQRPSLLRLKGFAGFGNLLFDVVVEDDAYTLVLPGEKQVFVGRWGAFTEVGKEQLPIQMSMRALQVILGQVQESPEDQIDAEWLGDRYEFTVTPAENGHEGRLVPPYRRRIVVDGQQFQVRHLDYLAAEGTVTFSVEAEDFRRVRNDAPVEEMTITVPFQVKATDYLADGTVILDFQEMVANAALKAKDFAIVRF